MLGIHGRNLRYCREHALSQTQQDLYNVQRMFYFVRYLVERITAGVNILDPDAPGALPLFSEHGTLQPPFERERDFVRRDLAAYERDVTRASVYALVLPVYGEPGHLHHATAIALEEPTSTLFTTWAHGDRRHALEGCALVLVGERQGHYRLSVNPTAGCSLQGLRGALERAEFTRRRGLESGEARALQHTLAGQTLVWNDQSAPAYTVVETTGQGTSLSMADVWQCVQDTAHWG
jgi:hypothetical protein